jgi:uncharacterized repeat protein (TIGR03803 family)
LCEAACENGKDSLAGRLRSQRAAGSGVLDKFSLLKTTRVVFVFCIATAIVSYGQTTFTSLINFEGTDGANPNSSVIQGADGTFYGTARFGGLSEANCAYPGCGAAFRLTPEGVLTVLYKFCSEAACADGAYPGGLVRFERREQRVTSLILKRTSDSSCAPRLGLKRKPRSRKPKAKPPSPPYFKYRPVIVLAALVCRAV